MSVRDDTSSRSLTAYVQGKPEAAPVATSLILSSSERKVGFLFRIGTASSIA